MINANFAIGAVCGALLVSAGAVWALFRFWLMPDNYLQGKEDGWREAEDMAKAEALHAVRPAAPAALAPAVHPAGVIAGEVTESFDWAPTDQLARWAGAGTPGRARASAATVGAARPVSRPGAEPPRVILARFRQDVDASMAAFERRLDELVAA